VAESLRIAMVQGTPIRLPNRPERRSHTKSALSALWCITRSLTSVSLVWLPGIPFYIGFRAFHFHSISVYSILVLSVLLIFVDGDGFNLLD
jgi:hypothetical protein